MESRCDYCAQLLRRRLAVELGAVAVFAAVYIGLFTGRPRWLDVALAAIAVAAIALDAGRSKRLWSAAAPPPGEGAQGRREMLVFTGCAVLVLAAAGAVIAPPGAPNDILSRLTSWHILVAIVLYFPWAWLQQFVFQFYLLGRLLHVLPPAAAVVVTAVAFSAVHFPRYPVMAVTAAAGAVWAASYRRHRRLVPVAASHAVLGPVLHYWVLGRDLLAGWLP